jgi:hypothetical protein
MSGRVVQRFKRHYLQDVPRIIYELAKRFKNISLLFEIQEGLVEVFGRKHPFLVQCGHFRQRL